MVKKVHFKTHTLLKNLVGKDLINDDNIAIVELVKNSYDARSSSVFIKFEGFSDKEKTFAGSRILIVDGGAGMNALDIEDKWLNLAYSEKKNIRQEDGAYLAGNKGIGRFSCDRLGECLDMFTRTRNGSLYHLKINWPDFEKEDDKDLTIQEIDMDLSKVSNEKAKKISGFKMPQSGTILIISKLRSVWDRNKLLDLKQMLEKFINPNQLFLSKKFKIDLSALEIKKHDKGKDYHEKVNGVIQNQIFENLKFNSTYIESSINKNGKIINTTLYHEGETVFRLKEKNRFYTELKNVGIVIYSLNPYKKAYFKRQTGIRSVDFGSIFLFLNGFRVAPYGDRSDDWLGLDVRKTQGITRYLSSRDLVGRIEVLGSEELFKPISSREGLKSTDAFLQLKDKYFYDVLRKLEKFVVDGLDWDSIPERLRDELRTSEGLDWENTSEQYKESWERKKQRIVLSIMTLIGSSQDRIISFWFNPSLLEGVYEQRAEEVKSLLANIEAFDENQVEPDLKRNLKKLGKILAEKEIELQAVKIDSVNLQVSVAEKEKKIRKLEKESDTYRAQTLFLQSVSSLDEKNLLAFHHQILLDADILNNYIGRAMKAARAVTGNNDLINYIEKISIANKRIMATAQFATKANFKAGTKKEITDIPAFFQQYILNVAKEFIATGLKLNVINSVNESFEIKTSRIELSILIDNIISNSIKAGAKALKILISKKDKNHLIISFTDNGKGLSASIKKPDDIFEIGVTSTSGSGLGLFHCRKIVNSLDGTIRVFPVKPKGLEVRMAFTK